MNRILEKLLIPYYTEYLVIDQNFVILETSSNAQRYADIPCEVLPGKDIRLAFPELIGIESTLINILQGRQKSFELMGIARSNEPTLSLYLDLYVTSYEDFLIILLEDATERMVLEQRLLQENHEKNILLNSLISYQNYLNKIITSMKDVLFVTTEFGKIITVNQAAIELFEYNQDQLINQSISIITNDINFLLHVEKINFSAHQECLKDNPFLCQTKTGKSLIVAFSSSLVATEPKGSHYVVYTGRDITEREIALTALSESEERFQTFMNNSPTVAFMKDYQGRYVYVNQTFEHTFNVKFNDLHLKTDFDWLPQDIANQVCKNDLHVLSTNESIQVIEDVPTLDKYPHYWLVSKFPFKDSRGQQLVGGMAVNITEQKLLEQQLFEEKELAQVTLKCIGDAVITTDASGRIKYLNPVAEKLTGWSKADALFLPVAEIFKIISEVTREPLKNIVEEVLSSGLSVSLNQEYLLIARDGREVAIDDSVAPIHAKNGKIIGAVIVFQDVSHKRNIARQLSWQATHDALTGLVNRKEFENRLFETLSSNKENQQHALCYLDLDRFKVVNDTCGHMAGDELLQQVAVLFQSLIRCSDTLARLGGDEFGILLKGCRLASALQITNTIVQRVQEFRFVWQDKTFNIGVSIGLVTINADSQSMNSLLNAADVACYTAKNKGRNCVHVYQADNSEVVKSKSEMQWVAQINQALENNSFSLYYQPIVPIISTNSNDKHYEVLLRFMDKMGNLTLPMAFIPAAERYDIMPAIDRWVISTLFANLGNSKKEKSNNCTTQESNRSFTYAINLSGATINDNKFIDFLSEQLVLHQIPAQAICFEITETVVTANLAQVASKVRAIKELGFRFALDNFGSSMSSWGYLKNLSIDYLKINGTLIKNIVEEKIDTAMVKAINEIAHLMGIKTVAEYVETQEIFEIIKKIGVDYAQGYGISKPCPLKIW